MRDVGIAGCFSFYPGKNLGAYGDGGAIATNDDDFATSLHHLKELWSVSQVRARLEGGELSMSCKQPYST